MDRNKLTTTPGNSFPEQDNSRSVRLADPVPMKDFILQENLANFVRERIPERVVNAKGSGAYGTFTVTGDITGYTRAKLFSNIGNTCRVFTRFSAMSGERGSADTERDLHGFAVKFYTHQGNWDLVGNSSPVFFIKDPGKFSALAHTQKKHPKKNLKSATALWDFWSLNPETLHQVMMLMSDRGTPYGYRHMNGYGAHTFSMTNDKGERFWVKFHLKTQQGIKNFTQHAAMNMRGQNPDFSQEDLVSAISGGDFPKWTLYIQVMSEEQAKDSRWNPFDVTKVWFHDEFPLIEAGVLELNEIPPHYFTHVEQAAFSPANLIDGIGFSPDPMLQGRLFSYPDAQRYRLGLNAHQLEVNRCPFDLDDNTHISTDESFGYGDFPQRFNKSSAVDAKMQMNAATNLPVSDFSYTVAEDDHFTQPGLLYTKAMDEDARNSLVHNIISSMKEIKGPRRDEIINRQLCHFFRANIEMGMKIASGLQINIDDNMMSHMKL